MKMWMWKSKLIIGKKEQNEKRERGKNENRYTKLEDKNE